MRKFGVAVAALLAVIGSGHAALASAPLSPDVRQPERAMIAITVVNEGGGAVSGAICTWADDRVEVRTNVEGVCRLTAKVGSRNELLVRALGFEQSTTQVEVVDLNTTIRVTLRRIPQRLPEVSVSANQRGIHGVVLTQDGRPIEGAEVRVLGSGDVARTDASGTFVLAPKSGVRTLRVYREGYYAQLASVEHTSETGAIVTIWMRLDAAKDAREIVRQANLFDLQQRLLRRGNSRFSTFGQQDIQRLNSSDLRRIVQFLTTDPPSPDACARIDGGPEWAPLWAIDPLNIVLLETAGEGRRAPRTTTGVLSPSAACRYVVWTR